MNGNAEKKCDGILVSQPSASGKVYASAAFWTLNVLKKPKMPIPSRFPAVVSFTYLF